jgi:viroplasmin and RNaseH domain-containing protein
MAHRGDVHPLVNGFPQALFAGFLTLEEAQEHMQEHKVEQYKYVIKEGAGTTSPIKGRDAYYAVANGRKPGIYQYY